MRYGTSLMLLILGNSALSGSARAAVADRAPIESATAVGTWEGLAVQGEGEVMITRLDVRRQGEATLEICLFNGTHVEPICELFPVTSLSIRSGRLKATGNASSRADVWNRVVITAKGTVVPGDGVLDAVIELLDKRGQRDTRFTTRLFLKEESLLEDVRSALEFFKTKRPSPGARK